MKELLSAPFGWATVFSVILTLLTAFVLLDTYVIPKEIVPISSVVTDETEISDTNYNTYISETTSEKSQNPVLPSEQNVGITPNETGAVSSMAVSETETVETTNTVAPASYGYTDNSYTDENISVVVSSYTLFETKVYIADVTLSDASYFKTAFAKGTFGRNITETTSDIATENNAILAINGDFCGFRNDGYVIRGGVLYRDIARSSYDDDALVCYGDGRFDIVNENDIAASALLDSGAKEVFSFGPSLVQNGEISANANTEVSNSMSSNPRTAIGIISPLHYIFAVSDGRTDESAGLSLYQLAEVMKAKGCTTAYNLDGGGSSTMWFNGKIVNKPTTNGSKIQERKVSDIVYIGY